MGFIKHALIGIALYEAVKYFLDKDDKGFDQVTTGSKVVPLASQQLRSESVDIIAGASQTGHLNQMRENAIKHQAFTNDTSGFVNTSPLYRQDSDEEFEAGTNPEAPLTGQESDSNQNDPWKKSLANDDLRAPDS